MAIKCAIAPGSSLLFGMFWMLLVQHKALPAQQTFTKLPQDPACKDASPLHELGCFARWFWLKAGALAGWLPLQCEPFDVFSRITVDSVVIYAICCVVLVMCDIKSVAI